MSGNIVDGGAVGARSRDAQRSPARKSSLRGWLSAGLVRVLREVLRDAGGRSSRLRWLASDCAPAPRSSEAARAVAAGRELTRVHLCELAYLLREASRLRRAHEATAVAVRACREGFAEALECARLDGLALPARWSALASLCASSGVAAWPRSVLLARTALEVEPCEEGRVELGRALLAAGEPRAAAAAMAAALLACRSVGRAAPLLDELARLEDRHGRRERAGLLRGYAAELREVA
jgi:hypothetical protein